MTWIRISYCTLVAFLVASFSSCKKEEVTIDPVKTPVMVIPDGFPDVPFPEGNEYTEARWNLGKKLFYDPIMSRSQTVSCASCHLADHAFSDTVALSLGDNMALGTQNAPTLANVAYHPYFTRAGGVMTLEMQILVPIQEHNEFDTNILDIVERMKSIPEYVQMAKEAYNREIDAFVITRSLANFERTLLSGNSPYDRYQRSGDESGMSSAAKRGMDLFFSERTNCSSCHGGFNFTNYAFENNGLYENYVDLGRMRLTHQVSDQAKFKVPTLRNIEVTAPYMHDGSMATLQQVIEHYNGGGANHPNKNTEFIKPLNLTNQEKSDLVAFLKSLTDEDFLNNKNFSK